MTKAQMIQTMQQLEAAAYLEFQKTAKHFGEDSNITRIECNRWSAVFEALKALGIEPDYQLPTQLEARRVQLQVEADRAMASE